MSLSLICNKQHKQYPGGCLACLYEENSALRAEVERLKKELERVYSCLAEIWGGMMTNQEIIDKVVADALTRGEGLMYIDPKKFWKRDPWYKRFWKWLAKS